MSFSKMILSLIACCGALAFAENTQIRGVVQDTIGTPICQATVAFKDGSISTTTDSAGIFSLQRTTAIDAKRKTAFNLAEKRVDVFDACGKLLLSQKQFVPENFGRLDLRNKLKRQGNYIVRISSVEETSLFKMDSQNNLVFLKTESPSNILVVSKQGFITKEVTIGAQDSIAIVLEYVPIAKINKYGAGSSSQTVEQGSAIIAFSFGFENADSIIVEGLPDGINAEYDAANSKINFSGIVTANPGEYTYTLKTLGEYTQATRQGKFTVTEATTSSSSKVDIFNIPVDGYASIEGGTTGGGNAKPDTVTTYAEFKSAVQAKEAKVVVIKGTIKTTDGDGYCLKIASNKTIVGYDSAATIYGGIQISGEKNVILYNFNMHGVYPNSGPDDAIAVNNSDHVFISHLNIWDAGDGNLDVTNQANYVTVSYVKFWYTDKNHPHRLNALIGSGASDHPEDFHKLKVTYHHCWFSTLVNERMPRVMYGNAHIYNNYYTAEGNLYCIGVGSYASALIEGNYFKKVKNPIYFMYNVYAFILQRSNKFDETTGAQDGTSSGKIYGERYITTDPYTLLEDPNKLTSVPYEYTLDKAEDIPSIVQKKAGPHNYNE